MDAEKKATMFMAVAEFQKVQKAYNDSTARLAEAEAHGKEAHDGYVKYKAAVDELQKEEAMLESRLSTVDADSAKTLFDLSVLKNYIDEMQHATETGAQDTYSARLISAMNTVDLLVTSDQNKNALRTALRSL
jgi:predicted nuclease with TOPRIM domain